MYKRSETLFCLICCERKTLFRLKKQAEQGEYGASRTGPIWKWGNHRLANKLVAESPGLGMLHLTN